MKDQRGFYDLFVRTCAKNASQVAVRDFEGDKCKNYSYSEMYGICEAIAQILQQLNCTEGIIGVVSRTNFIVPCMVAAAHKSSTAFMFLDLTNLNHNIEDINFSVVVSILKEDDDTIQTVTSRPPSRCLYLFDFKICFYVYGTLTNYKFSSEYSYIALTSGTTGKPKKIQVPMRCIMPNITDLTKIFNITGEDVIYFSTPLTFDPSIVEILLAFANGASLLIAPCRIEKLFPRNRKNSITVWQTTPSKFFQLSNLHIRTKILCKKSPLKILALGGEPLTSLKRLKELKHSENKTKIFALYGVTEMSCWACVAELNLAKTDKEVPLGKCLSETEVIVKPLSERKPSGQIVLVSKTRNCIILKKTSSNKTETSLKFINTGDLGEIGDEGIIYYRGRIDNVIKRFGHKINLQFIETTVMSCPKIKTCSCIWLPKPRLLIVYFSSELFSSKDLSDFLKCRLDDKHWPDRIVRVENLPTTAHGKISKPQLSLIPVEPTEPSPKMFTFQELKLIFLEEFKHLFRKHSSYYEIKNNNFFSMGGTSFTAVSLCNKISYSYPELGQCLLPLLIDQSRSINEVLKCVYAAIEVKEGEEPKPKKSKSELILQTSPDITVSHQNNTVLDMQFVEMWTYNTGKCVDASPSLIQVGLNLYVTVGSHSGKVVVIDTITGFTVGVINLKSRVEAAVLCCQASEQMPACGVVGAYDGTVICFTIETCQLIWKFSVSGMIKSKATYCDGMVYLASYHGCIWCINLKSGTIEREIQISELAISADLVLAKGAFVLVGSLSGVVCAVHAPSRSVAWRATLDSPVFAAPALYADDKYVVFAEVSGEMHCRTVEKGIKIWTFLGVRHNIFSSICVSKVSEEKYQLVFGCHDNCVYCLSVENIQPRLKWKTPLSSPIYSTPCLLTEQLLLVANNVGKLTVVNLADGAPLTEYVLAGETFSSPAVYEDYIFIGCRNDLVYAFKFVLDS